MNISTGVSGHRTLHDIRVCGGGVNGFGDFDDLGCLSELEGKNGGDGRKSEFHWNEGLG